MAKRERPADGGVTWHPELHAFECHGCNGFEEVRSRHVRENPEMLRRKLEAVIWDHTECWDFDDPEMARRHRKFRKKKAEQENLARMAVSWRGRQ